MNPRDEARYQAARQQLAASPDDLDAMTPVERAKFIDLMHHWWRAALQKQHPLNPHAGGVAARAGEHAVTSK